MVISTPWALYFSMVESRAAVVWKMTSLSVCMRRILMPKDAATRSTMAMASGTSVLDLSLHISDQLE